MHPALSIIVFTTLSGLGYGLAAALGLGFADATLPAGRIGYALALVLIGSGLISSTFHLGHPERAWRALSQWRSSWLSREGILSIVTFLPLGLAALGSVFLGQFWGIFGLLGAILALATVYSTSMIYASLRTIFQWNSGLTSVVFLALAVSGGLLIAATLSALFGADSHLAKLAALTALAAAFAAKLLWWKRAGDEAGPSTIETATGLGKYGSVRRLEQPHQTANYLTREMGFRVARRHAETLRKGVIIFAFAVPALALLVALVSSPAIGAVLLVIGLLAHVAGVLVERWLFFAEAEHAVGAYYGLR